MPRRARALTALICVLGTGVLAGCTSEDPSSGETSATSPGPTSVAEPAGPSPNATPAAPPPLTASSTAAEVRERGGAVGAVWIGYLDDAVQEVTVQDGPTHRVIELGAAAGEAGQSVLALIAAPESGTVEVLGDGSAVVRLGAVVVAAVDPPALVDAADGAAGSGSATEGTAEPTPRPAVRLVAVGADVLQVVLDRRGPDAGAATAPRVELSVAEHAVASLTWGDREGGRSLAVEPTDWARSAGEAGTELLWSDLVTAEPEADLPTMRDQLVCHRLGAPDKATWNLEPWRPDIGLLPTMAAACNPT